MFKLLVIFGVVFAGHMMAEVKVLAFAGSTREGSFNKALLVEAANSARQKGASVKVIDLKDYPMPFYDADLEAKEGMPIKAKQLRDEMIQSQVILIASPEYNASVPAVLKNALDWASRKEEGGTSREAFKGKKFVLMSASPGSKGGARGLIHLKAIIEDVGGTVISEQFSVPNAYSAFDNQGHLKNPKLKSELQKLVESALTN